MNGCFNVEDEYGTACGAGIASFEAARDAAQARADRDGRTWYVTGLDAAGDEIEPEAVESRASDWLLTCLRAEARVDAAAQVAS